MLGGEGVHIDVDRNRIRAALVADQIPDVDGGILAEFVELAEKGVVHPEHFGTGVEWTAGQADLSGGGLLEANQLYLGIEGLAANHRTGKDVHLLYPLAEVLGKEDIVSRDVDDPAQTVGLRLSLALGVGDADKLAPPGGERSLQSQTEAGGIAGIADEFAQVFFGGAHEISISCLVIASGQGCR